MVKDEKYILKLAKRLCETHSVATEEHSCLEVLREELSPMCDDAYYDRIGNLIAVKRAAVDGAKKLLLTAGIDAAGFVVCHIEENGRIRVGKLGNVNVTASLYSKIKFASGNCGVILPVNQSKTTGLSDGDIYIDIGAKNAEEAKNIVKVGETAALCEMTELSGGRRYHSGLSSKLCAAALASAFLKIKPTCNVYAVFTVESVLGNRGLETAVGELMPDCAISLGYYDKATVKSGGGVSIAVKEKSGVYSPSVADALEDAAKKIKPPFDFSRAVLDSDVGECGILLRSGALCGKLCIPCENYGTNAETAEVADAANMEALVARFVG